MEQNNKGQSLEEMAEAAYPAKTKKEYNQATTVPYVPYWEYMDKIELQQTAFIAGTKAMQVSSSVEKESAVGEGWVSVECILKLVVSLQELKEKTLDQYHKSDEGMKSILSHENMVLGLAISEIKKLLPHPPTQTEVNK